MTLPPERSRQNAILEKVESQNRDKDPFLKNSISQFDCHSYFFFKKIWLPYQIISFLLFPFLFLILIIRPGRKKITSHENICLYPQIPSLIKEKYNPVYIKKPFGSLKRTDLKYAFKILSHSGFRPYFILKSIWKIAVYSELLDLYQPKKILVTQEMVFESSILTNYLRDKGVLHINFMHGEKWFSIQDAFCSFDIFYVWDEHYIKIFQSLKCQITEYRLFPAIDIPKTTLPEKNILKYYHQLTLSAEDFRLILNNLKEFALARNCDLIVRLHPRHTKPYEKDVLQAMQVCSEPHSVDLLDSISESKFICSESSSVLYQASLLKKILIIDNTFPERIKILKDLDMIFLTKLKHEFLVTK